MPLIRHRELPVWARLEQEGVELIDPSEAQACAAPSLHVGFLNMMPDRALKATERQFLRLMAAGARHCNVYVHPFTIAGLDRDAETLSYVAKAYDSFDQIQSCQLDGLVLTGANPGNANITAEKYWPYFEAVTHWANAAVPSIFCSCLASHAILKLLYGVERTRCQPDKRWGVFTHEVLQRDHPLMDGMPKLYAEPRSHVFEMLARQLEPLGVEILAASPDADFGIATSKDGIKWVFLQGHPEYDAVSLLKEYKREINRFRLGERTQYPESPCNYLPGAAQPTLQAFRETFLQAQQSGAPLPEFPESELVALLDNRWEAHAKVLFRNWLDQVVVVKQQLNSKSTAIESR